MPDKQRNLKSFGMLSNMSSSDPLWAQGSFYQTRRNSSGSREAQSYSLQNGICLCSWLGRSGRRRDFRKQDRMGFVYWICLCPGDQLEILVKAQITEHGMITCLWEKSKCRQKQAEKIIWWWGVWNSEADCVGRLHMPKQMVLKLQSHLHMACGLQ